MGKQLTEGQKLIGSYNSNGDRGIEMLKKQASQLVDDMVSEFQEKSKDWLDEDKGEGRRRIALFKTHIETAMVLGIKSLFPVK